MLYNFDDFTASRVVHVLEIEVKGQSSSSGRVNVIKKNADYYLPIAAAASFVKSCLASDYSVEVRTPKSLQLRLHLGSNAGITDVKITVSGTSEAISDIQDQLEA